MTKGSGGSGGRSTGSSNKGTSSAKTSGHGGGSTKMTSQDASRIQSAADKNPHSPSAESGFKERAASAAAKNQQ
jgi:hypothetical protein